MYDVIVIGGGFAGLSASVALAGRGARVLVLEARPRLGGRASSHRDQSTGELVDNGQHVVFGCYRETFRFLRAIGAAGNVRLQTTLGVTMIDRNGRRSELRCPPLPPPLHLAAAVLEWDALPLRERLSILQMARPLSLARQQLRAPSARLTASPGETVENWLVVNGQSPRLREMLWEPLALAALNQSVSEAAAPPFVRVLAELFGTDASDSAIGIPIKPLVEAYAEPAAQFLRAHEGEVRTSAQAIVEISPDGPPVAHVKGERFTADAVISAVPWYALADLLPGSTEDGSPLRGTIEAASRMDSSPIVTVNLWYDQPIMREPFIGLPGRHMQWMFDKGAIVGGEASHLSLVSSGAASILRLSNDAVIALAVDEVNDALPDSRSARLLRAVVVREPHATFSLAPGQPNRPSSRTAVPGLFLAGDWIDTGLPGTIESAVASGHQAASEVAAA